MFRYYYRAPSSHWDFVRPSYWHPMASLEQSLMDLDALDRDFPLLPHHHLNHRHLHLRHTADDDDEFFKDLPHAKATKEAATTATTTPTPASNDPDHTTTPPKPAYSNYSYSSSTVVDDKGRRVRSVRRRYEDANGRLKAVHERELDGKTLVTTWNRATKDDDGTHETICSDGVASPDDFEALWKDTPFAKAHQAGEALPAAYQTKALPKDADPAVDSARQEDAAMA